MDRQFFSGNTLEQAILAAARHHDLEPERVAYSLRDKKHGFVNIRRRVVIEVDPDAPELPEGTRADSEPSPDVEAVPEPRQEQSEAPWWVAGPSADRSVEDPTGRSTNEDDFGGSGWRGEDLSWAEDAGEDREVEAIEKAVDEISQLLAIPVQPSIERDEEGYEIDLSGAGTEPLREHRGSGLAAIEHLLPRMVRGFNGQGVPCRVDSEGFREAYEEKLARLALSTADDVQQALKERRLEPMNPADRRVVHMALADHPDVFTESEGRGFMKRVRIIPM